jgi:hypothetical protein
MRKSRGFVQKLDIGVPTLRGLVSGTLRNVRQVTETWKVRFCGVVASRERVETTLEAVDEVSRDRR